MIRNSGCLWFCVLVMMNTLNLCFLNWPASAATNSARAASRSCLRLVKIQRMQLLRGGKEPSRLIQDSGEDFQDPILHAPGN